MCAKEMSSGSFKNIINKIFTNHINVIDMYKEDLALINLKWLICHKTQPNQIIMPLNKIETIIYLFYLLHATLLKAYRSLPNFPLQL